MGNLENALLIRHVDKPSQTLRKLTSPQQQHWTYFLLYIAGKFNVTAECFRKPMPTVHSFLLCFFATLLRAFGFGCVCIFMGGSRILLPCRFVGSLPRVLCNTVIRSLLCCVSMPRIRSTRNRSASPNLKVQAKGHAQL